jgi:uncharacterized DUF497 family protein
MTIAGAKLATRDAFRWCLWTRHIFVRTIKEDVMEIQFDSAKSRANRRKHGLPLADAKRLDWDSMIAWIDDSQDYGEKRWVGIAPLGRGSLHTVEVDEETARVISLRRSTNQEARTYAAQTGHK